MDTEETIEIFEITKNTVATFENKTNKLSHNHLDILISLAYYIHYDVDDTENVLKAEFDKCMKNYKMFCNKYSKFIIFKEARLSLSAVGETDLKGINWFRF